MNAAFLRPLRWHTAAALAVALAVPLAAPIARADDFPTPPPPAAPRALKIATPTERSLPNGLRVVVAERPGLPLVTTELLVQTGSAADPDNLAGLAALTAGTLDKGSAKHSAPQIAQTAESLGGSIGTGAGWHAMSVGMTVTRPKLDAALDLMAEVARTPTFAPAEIDRVRRQMLDGLKVSLADPRRLAGLAANRAVFGASVYGQSRSGTPATLARITRADLVRAHNAAFRPDNAVLVFAGDITLDDAVALATKALGDWKRPTQALAQAPVGAPQPIAAPLVVVDMPGAGQAGVVVAIPSIARNAPDWTIGQVANAVLGAGYSSRLNQEIRIKRGLSYGAGSGIDARRAGGIFTAATQTKNESAPQVLDLIRTEIARMAATAPADDELAARKATLIGNFSRSLETTDGLAGNVASLVTDALPLDQLGRFIAEIEAVSPQQVQSFAQAHWPAGQERAVVVGDAKQFGAALTAANPQALTIARDRLDLDRADLVQH